MADPTGQTNDLSENSATIPGENVSEAARVRAVETVQPPAHTKKSWRSYAWEFLMLFLAVFCSYLAEYRLDASFEKTREKQYIGSLLRDLENDTLQFAKTTQKLERKIPYYDSVLNFLANPAKYHNSLPFRFYIKTNLEQFYRPANATLDQLKSSGNLRLIHQQYIIDSIVYYDSRINGEYKNQIDYVIEANKRLIHASETIFDLGRFNRFINDLDADSTADDISGYDTPLFTQDKLALQSVSNIYISTKATDFFYLKLVRATNDKARRLLIFLNREYHPG